MIEDGVFIPGSACWIDVSTADPAGSRDFYAGLFGWTYHIDPDARHSQYATAMLGDRPVGGIAGAPVRSGQPVKWTLYLNSANLSHTAAVIEEWGGQVYYGPTDVPGQGSVLVGADPTGGELGFWRPATPWAFHTAESGSLIWAELNTWEGHRADEFFASLFGYRQDQIGPDVGGDYTTWSLGEHTILGRFQMSEDQSLDTPSYWMLYFAVDPETGTDGAVNRVLELGGRVNIYPFDSGLGRIAVVQDPSGAVFSLLDTTRQLPPLRSGAGADDPYDD
ncbi:MAG: VOC family protein [Pseudonocardiaceae bacterium]